MVFMILNWDFTPFFWPNTVRLGRVKLFLPILGFLDQTTSFLWWNLHKITENLSFLRCSWLITHDKTQNLHTFLLQKCPYVIYKVTHNQFQTRHHVFMTRIEAPNTMFPKKLYFFPVSNDSRICVSSKFWGPFNARTINNSLPTALLTPQDGAVPMAPNRSFSLCFKKKTRGKSPHSSKFRSTQTYGVKWENRIR